MNKQNNDSRKHGLESDITENDIIPETTETEDTQNNVKEHKKRKYLSIDFPKLKEKAAVLARRMSTVKARPVIIGVSVVIVGLAVYFNWMLFSDTGTDADVDENTGGENLLGQSVYVDGDAGFEEEESYFAMSQLSRQRARDEALEVLQLVIDDEAALKEVKDQAYADANRMAAEIASEANIETLVMAKGFEDCVAVISNRNASIIVKTGGLLQNEIAQIKEIVYEQAGILPVNIKIIEKN